MVDANVLIAIMCDKIAVRTFGLVKCMQDMTKRWIDISDEDFNMGEIAFEHGRYLHMVFFCQQSIEKALKGLYTEINQCTPPRKHDLLALAASCGIVDKLSLEQQTFLATVSEYYIESRYPEDRANLSIPLTKMVAAVMLSETKEALVWIKNMLK